jgi:hypothetical protein
VAALANAAAAINTPRSTQRAQRTKQFIVR